MTELESIYIRSFWHSVMKSAQKYEPIRIDGYFDIMVQKWIFKHKMFGEDLPMPSGIVQRIDENKIKTYNGKYNNGDIIKFTINESVYIGIVKKRIGENNLSVLKCIIFEKYNFRSSIRYKWSTTTGITLITPENYNRNRAYNWLKNNIKRIDPIISAKELLKIVK